MSSSLLALHHQVTCRPRPVDRVWSWAFATRVAALHPLLVAPEGPVCCFDWIEPEMAWACEDLEDAGAQPADLDVPQVEIASSLDLVVRLLSAVASCDVDGIEDAAQGHACRDAVTRARACLAALGDVAAAEPHEPAAAAVAA